MASTKRRSPVPLGSLTLAALQGLCANPNHPPGEHPSSGKLEDMPAKLAKRAVAIARAVETELARDEDEES